MSRGLCSGEERVKCDSNPLISTKRALSRAPRFKSGCWWFARNRKPCVDTSRRVPSLHEVVPLLRRARVAAHGCVQQGQRLIAQERRLPWAQVVRAAICRNFGCLPPVLLSQRSRREVCGRPLPALRKASRLSARLSAAGRRAETGAAKIEGSPARSRRTSPNRNGAVRRPHGSAAEGAGTHRARLVTVKSKERPETVHTVAPNAGEYWRLRQFRSHRWVPCIWHSNRLPKLRRMPAAEQAAVQAPEQFMVAPARSAREPRRRLPQTRLLQSAAAHGLEEDPDPGLAGVGERVAS